MKKAVAYIRVSTDGQTKEDSYGIEEQRNDITKWCGENDYEITQWFVEQISGKVGIEKKRPVFDEILNGAITNPPVEAVIIARNDRLARDITVFFGYKFLLLRNKINLISISEDFGAYGNMFSDILEMFTVATAKLEREHITVRTSGGRALKAKEGGYSGGRAPFGYTVRDHNLAINPDEAQIVEKIYEMRGQGLTMPQIADELNKLGYHNRSGNLFSFSNVQKILANEKTYRGFYKYGNMEWVKGKHDPILK